MIKYISSAWARATASVAAVVAGAFGWADRVARATAGGTAKVIGPWAANYVGLLLGITFGLFINTVRLLARVSVIILFIAGLGMAGLYVAQSYAAPRLGVSVLETPYYQARPIRRTLTKWGWADAPRVTDRAGITRTAIMPDGSTAIEIPGKGWAQIRVDYKTLPGKQ